MHETDQVVLTVDAELQLDVRDTRGMPHRLPSKGELEGRCLAENPKASCRYTKMITPKTARRLGLDGYEVTVPPEVGPRLARLDCMVAIG